LTGGIRYSGNDDCGGARRRHGGWPTSKPREHQLRIRPVVPLLAGHWAPGPHPPATGRSTTSCQTAAAVSLPLPRPPNARRARLAGGEPAPRFRVP
jgi:hypothetical protein